MEMSEAERERSAAGGERKKEIIGNKESSQQLNLEFKLKYLEDKISEDSNSNVCYSSFR
jgi:hypothetical protein